MLRINKVIIMKNAINWFEIPTIDFERAVNFYEAIFGFTMKIQNFPALRMAFFPFDIKEGVGGSLIHNAEFYQPSEKGALIYLNANPDLENVLSKVEKAGGKVLIKKRNISPEVGDMGVFIDTEGNRI